MTWSQVAAESPFLTALVLIVLIVTVSGALVTAWNRTLRVFNIYKNGWPPEHCDADGDLTEMYREQSKRHGLG